MRRFKNLGLVINLEHSNAGVLAQAKELVETNDVSIHMICVTDEALKPEHQSSIEKTLRTKSPFDFTLTFKVGKPLIEISHFIQALHLDMILIEADQEKGFFEQIFQDPLALSLMRKAPCPVWVVKRPSTSTYQRIAIAIDALQSQDSLTDKLIQIGTSYAKQQSAECFLVTAWHLEEEGMLNGPFIDMPPEELDRLKIEAHQHYAQAFEAVQKKHHQILEGCQRIMLDGKPAHAIAQFLKDKNIDLLIIGTLARAGIPGFFIGNTAESIIHLTDCSIMAIKPDGFISPVS